MELEEKLEEIESGLPQERNTFSYLIEDPINKDTYMGVLFESLPKKDNIWNQIHEIMFPLDFYQKNDRELVRLIKYEPELGEDSGITMQINSNDEELKKYFSEVAEEYKFEISGNYLV